MLSRALGNRRSWRLRRGSPAAGAGEAGTVAGDGEGEGDDAETRDSDIPPAQETVGEQLAQRQLAVLCQQWSRICREKN